MLLSLLFYPVAFVSATSSLTHACRSKAEEKNIKEADMEPEEQAGLSY